MSIALLIMTDGRTAELERCYESLCTRMVGPVREFWVHDDTGDPLARLDISVRYPRMTVLGEGPRRGFGGAIAYAWQHLAARTTCRYIFHVEQDFVLTRAVDLHPMTALLDNDPTIAQVALRRQPWAPQEHAAGGVIEMHPEAYQDQEVMLPGERRPHPYLTHRLFFTTNPSVFRRSLLSTGWPTGPRSEGVFTAHLLQHGTPEAPGDQVRFAYWGARTDKPWVEHIGHTRVGTGY